jgi:hypothetical protein
MFPPLEELEMFLHDRSSHRHKDITSLKASLAKTIYFAVFVKQWSNWNILFTATFAREETLTCVGAIIVMAYTAMNTVVYWWR